MTTSFSCNRCMFMIKFGIEDVFHFGGVIQKRDTSAKMNEEIEEYLKKFPDRAKLKYDYVAEHQFVTEITQILGRIVTFSFFIVVGLFSSFNRFADELVAGIIDFRHSKV